MPEREGKRAGRDGPTPVDVVKTVLSAFFGVRRRADHDAVKLNPLHVVVTGLAMAAIFVVCLILLVKFIVSSAA